MEKTTTLNPFAPPYHKNPPSLRYINTFPQPHHLAPPPSSSGSKTFSARTPVPWGPRIPLYRLPPRRRRVKNPVRSGNSGGGIQQLRWRPKSAEKNAAVNVTGKLGFEGRKRWKNTSGYYHQTLPMESKTTSVMIKNVPNRYTRELLIQTLDNHCKLDNEKFINETEFIAAYDYLYLPIDFSSRSNAGFAFVNFTNPKAALRFKEAFDGKRWGFFDSPKVAQISRAKIQGKMAMINYCKKMNFIGGSDEDLPVVFEPARDGSGRVDSRMFKLGKIRN